MVVLLAEYLIVTWLPLGEKAQNFFNNAMLDYLVDITSLNAVTRPNLANKVFFQ